MSTHDGSGIPFEVSTIPQNIRLLELPLTLLDLIRSDHPSNLTLKSTATTSDGSQQGPAYAVLCTDKQTYQVRQVQSSNSVFITQPSEKPFGSDGIPVAGISAIAHCPTLLELIPSSPPSIAFLRQNLPLYMGSESEDGVILSGVDPADPLDKQSKNNLLKDAPFSTGEFEHAWKELCAFESGDQSWIPAAQPCANCWKAIIAAATIRSLDLGEGFPTTVLAGTVEEDGHPVALLEAVLARLSADDRDMMDGHAQLDSAKCVPWVGAVLLESRTSSRTGGVGVMEFMRIWHDLLPEGWRSQASLVALEGKYSQASRTTIAFDENGSVGNAAASAAPKATTAKAKPNWHEKFRNTKR